MPDSPTQEHAHDGHAVQVEHTGPCTATVSFTVTAEEYARTRDLGLKNVARRTRMKGFRPGKMPRALVEKHFGGEVDREAIQHFLNHAYDIAVREHELRPAANPRVDVETIAAPAQGSELQHSFEVWLRPKVQLGTYRGLRVAPQPTEVGDEELEKTLEDLRRQNARPEPAGDEGLTADGMAVCKVEFLVEGRGEPVLSREGLRLSPGTPPAGVDREAYRQGMAGAKAGETREFPLVVPETFPEAAVRGAQGTCRLTLGHVYRAVVPSEEELATALRLEGSAALREELHRRIRAAKEEQERLRIENEILERLLVEHPMDLPAPLLEAQAEARVGELRQSLSEQGFPAEEMEERLKEERAQALQASGRALRAVYLMEEIAKTEGLKVSESDLVGEMRSIAERNQTELEEVRKYYRKEGLLQQLALELLERKVRSFLRESADIQGA